MTTSAEPVLVDLSDFDAVGILANVILALRANAIDRNEDVAATVSAPDAWHRLIITCSSTGNIVLRVRFTDLTVSRAKNVAKALAQRGWQLDEDRDGAAIRQKPGIEATEIAFVALATLSCAGAPSDTRTVTGATVTGTPISLHLE